MGIDVLLTRWNIFQVRFLFSYYRHWTSSARESLLPRTFHLHLLPRRDGNVITKIIRIGIDMENGTAVLRWQITVRKSQCLRNSRWATKKYPVTLVTWFCRWVLICGLFYASQSLARRFGEQWTKSLTIFDVFSQKGCWHGGPKTSEEFIRISDW